MLGEFFLLGLMMRRSVAFLVVLFGITPVFCSKTAIPESLVDKVLETKNQTTLQQTANLLMLFITEKPRVADQILSEEIKNADITKAKTAALDAIQKTCVNCNLNQLQSEPMHKIKHYEDSLNKLYQKICSRLDRRFRKVIYGPNKGKELPKRLRFFLRAQVKKKSHNKTRMANNEAPDPIDNMIYIPFLQKLSSLFC